jgi:hypothetical protein
VKDSGINISPESLTKLISVIAEILGVTEMQKDIAAIKSKIYGEASMSPPKYFSLEGVIDYIAERSGKRYAKQTIYDKVAKGEIPCKKRKKPLMFEQSEIDKFLAGDIPDNDSDSEIKLKINHKKRKY